MSARPAAFGLFCDDEALAARLRARPSRRNTSDGLIEEHVELNHWLKEHAATAEPPVTLIDTTSAAVTGTAALVVSMRVTGGSAVAAFSLSQWLNSTCSLINSSDVLRHEGRARSRTANA